MPPARTDRFEDGELPVIRGAPEGVQDHPVDPAKHCRDGGNDKRQSKHCDRSQRGVRRRTAAAYRRSSRTLRMGFLSLSAIWLPTVDA
jgi:hypothetical protein